ncbi:MAG: ExbD/TolR family protein [Pseudobdellovibrionaceae bacterium]
MAIFKPGQRHRYHNILGKRSQKRDVTTTLSLTAMVDMFTVLVIFLLQNYNATGEILYIPKEVVLPKAATVKELKPATVVTISNKEILIDKDSVITFEQVRNQEQWLIQPLFEKVQLAIQKAQQDQEQKLRMQIKNVIDDTRGDPAENENNWKKITIQADKGIDFLTVKKVMYTVSEAGAGEINFAVTKTVNDATNAN